MYSKATAALNRLKEIDRKYNIKTKEVRSPEVSVSTESTLNSSISSPRTLKFGVNGPSKTGLKSKIEVQMQNIYTKNVDSNSSLSEERDKSRETGSTESSRTPSHSIVEIQTEQTNLNILSEKYISKKLLDVSTIKKEINGRAEEKSENDSSVEESIVSTIIGKISENSSGRNVGSSIGDRKRDGAPEATIREQNNKDENDFGNSSETTIDEVIGTEIISEMSRSTENDKRLRTGTSSGTDVSVKMKNLDVENGYASDTFEDISSSTEFLKSKDDLVNQIKAQSEGEDGGGDNVRSGVKGVKISPYKHSEHHEEDVNNIRAKQVVEIVAPKPMQTSSECELGLDDELSNYVKSIEGLNDESIRLTPISLLKSSSSSRKPKRRLKKHEKHPKESTNESGRVIEPIDNSSISKAYQHKERRSVRKNPIKLTPRNEHNFEKTNTSKFERNSFVTENKIKLLNAKGKSVNKYPAKISRSSESSIISEVTEANESENEGESELSAAKTKQMNSARRKSAGKGEVCLLMKNDSLCAGNKVINVDIERKASKENRLVEREMENTPGDSFPVEFPGKLVAKEDATRVLRKLNRDAFDAIARRHRFTGIESEKPGDNCTPFAERSGNPGRKIGTNEKTFAFAENVKTPSEEHGNKRRKSKVQMKASKSGKVHKTISHVRAEEKSSRFECKQMHHHLRKKKAALRLQEERQDIRNVLLELEKAKIKLGGTTFDSSKVPVFKPLEFPKIMEFEKPDSDDLDLESADSTKILQDRVLTIRQWLKDQYILYRKYSELAQTLNAKYVPSSLEDAKETIRQLRGAVDKVR